MMETRRRNKILKKNSQKTQNLPTVKSSAVAFEERDIPQMEDVWRPGSYLAFKAFLSARFCAAIWGLINDCDEVYNYWEPTHYLLTGKGFQTWEYSPLYALRSYGYLMIHAVPAMIYENLLQSNHILTFFFIRCMIALFCSSCELYFYNGVCKRFGANIARIYLGTTVLSAGMFISTTAYLPSSFALHMTLVAYGGWFDDNLKVAIFATALSTFLGWPFSVLNGLPIAIDMIFFKRKCVLFIKWSLIFGLVIALLMVTVDSLYYGSVTFAPANLVLYNVFSSHGPNLYGTEPCYFYFFNCILNFNIAFILGIIGLPIIMLLSAFPFLSKSMPYLPASKSKNDSSQSYLFLALSPLHLWLVVFSLQPHKEERFLFPVYPILILNFAYFINFIQLMFSVCIKKVKHVSHCNSSWIAILLVSLTSLTSLSRIVGQYQAYHAPFSVFLELNRLETEGYITAKQSVNICLGREWHRFPSSFFLPADNWNLNFIQSEFRGQLPKPYLGHENATRIIPSEMNDLNKEEVSRYASVSSCHFIVDLDRSEETGREPRFSLMTEHWSVIYSVPFLENHKSNVLLRAFYIPFLTERFCNYVDYVILQSKRLKLSN